VPQISIYRAGCNASWALLRRPEFMSVRSRGSNGQADATSACKFEEKPFHLCVILFRPGRSSATAIMFVFFRKPPALQNISLSRRRNSHLIAIFQKPPAVAFAGNPLHRPPPFPSPSVPPLSHLAPPGHRGVHRSRCRVVPLPTPSLFHTG
jgi:hypothetical protein